MQETFGNGGRVGNSKIPVPKCFHRDSNSNFAYVKSQLSIFIKLANFSLSDSVAKWDPFANAFECISNAFVGLAWESRI